MNNQSDKSIHIKHSKEEDLELVKISILRSRTSPIEVGVAKNITRTEPDKEINDTHFKSFEQGYQSLIAKIEGDAIEGTFSRDANINPIPIENFRINPNKWQPLKKILKGGASSKEIVNIICDFSPDVLLLFYEIGIFFYEEALYEKSINAFIFLTTINPRVQSFWIGLGLAHEKNLNFEKAIESFETAFNSDPKDFSPYYGLMRCCETIKDFKKIEDLLNAAIDNQAIKEQVTDALEYIKSKK